MPSFTPTPAQLAWAGGDITLEPVRLGFTSAALSWTGGTISVGANLAVGLSVTAPRLDRLTRGQEYYDNKGRVGVQMQSLWQRNVESVEDAFTALTSQVAAIQAALDAAQAAQNTATDAAQTAQTVQSNVELANSYTVPVNGNLSVTSAGVLTISAHQRYYSETSTVDVDGGTVTGLLEGVFYRVYYDDAAREGGAVIYQATTADISQSGATHIVGAVRVPVSGDPPGGGVGAPPPGYITDPTDLQ